MNYTNHNLALRNSGLFERSMSLRVLYEVYPSVLILENIHSRLQAIWPHIITNVSANETDVTTVNASQGNGWTHNYNSYLSEHSVSDENSRSVAYTQTGGDLTDVIGLENANWQYTYDPLHRLKTVVNPVGVTLVDNTYDDSDRVIIQLAPRKTGTVTYKMHYTGLTSVDEDPSGNRITYHYDFSGRKVAIENALGNKATTEFDGQNHPIKRVDPRGNATTVLYDANNNIRFINDPLNKQTENVYDAQYRLTDVIDPLSNTTQFEYDAEHHLTLVRDALLNQASSTYLPNGQTQTSTDGRGTVTSYTYDTLGNPDTTKVGAHPVVNVAYDAIGRLQSLTDQAGATTSFVVDNRGLVTQVTDPLSKQTNSSYDDVGRLVSMTDRNNDTISVGYTPSGKLDTLTYPGPTTVSYNYDSRDNLSTMVDTQGTTTNTFDAANRLTSVTDANGFMISYGYDEAGNVTSLTYPGNKTVTYTYDALNRLETVTNWLSQTATYTYDNASRLTQLINFNGSITDYGYDNANRLISLNNQTSTSSTIASYQFPVLDGNGNRKQEIREEPLPPSNLTTETTNFNYNAVKNRLQSTTLDSFLYDFEGQLSDKSSTPFTFDYAHRLTGISASIQYNYDGAGNRLKATRNGIVTKYLYDANGNLLAEADSTNTITKYYIHGAGLLALIEGSNTYTYHYNAVGSTVAITDNSQNIVNAYSYGPYGKILNELETIAQPFKYVGQYGVMFEPGVEFYYMRARYYDPDVGRFIKEDPIGFEGGLNLYAYVGGNPVNGIDPSGEAWFKPDDHPYKTGRLGDPLVAPGYGTDAVLDGGYLDDYGPAVHTFSYMHDNLVDSLTTIGVPDWLANIPTMLPTYAAAVGRETLNSTLKVFGNNSLEHQPSPAASQQGRGAKQGGCSPKCF